MIEDEAALEALLDALTDESPQVRKQSLWAVAQISG
jgi:HEAT repeat protein